MARFKPSTPFTVPMKLLVPTTSSSYGVVTKSFSDPKDSMLFYGSFRTFGGTENTANGLYTVISTGVINTWYHPDIKADCEIYLCDTGEIWEIVSEPEDIDYRHQYMQFKVHKIGGKA